MGRPTYLRALFCALVGACALTCGTTEVTFDIDEVEDYDGDGVSYFDGDCDDEDLLIYPGADERCNGEDDDCDGAADEEVEITYYVDADGDGYGGETAYVGGCSIGSGASENGDDCDDTDNTTYPGATETCDDVDNDCDDEIDTDAADENKNDFYEDADEDGYGDPEGPTFTCDSEAPSGYVDDDTDCDDGDRHISPEDAEECDGVDDDCDGLTDEGFDADGSGVADCFEEYCNGVDDDGDGICDEGWDEDEDGYTSCGIPCDDVDYVLPDDCDADTDVDEDGILTCSYDCDDDDPDVNPGALEICDDADLDEDCDGLTEEEDDALDPDSQLLLFVDRDGDGYGSGADAGTYYCDAQSGLVLNDSDCDDTRSWVNEGASELCNGRDDDCDGDTDEDAGDTFYQDGDGDGYGNPDLSEQSCTPLQGYVANAADCDDSAASIYPYAVETCNDTDDDCDGTVDDGLTLNACGECGALLEESCNGEDDDCDGDIDEGLDTAVFYEDADGDGYGDPDAPDDLCVISDGFSDDASDCDDGDAAINPEAEESCDGDDNDCDSKTDEGLDADTWYRDRDGDGFGDSAVTKTYCDQPSGYVASGRDCDDGDKNSYPGAPELCDGDDNDCDGDVDESTGDTWYFDGDGDGYGQDAISTTLCDGASGYASLPGDCDDTDAAAHPGATEVCDYADNDCDGEDDDGATNACGTCEALAEETCNDADDDCDGAVDEGVLVSLYVDDDGDGYGLSTSVESACESGDGYATLGGDCDDDDDATYPGADETCDTLDNDCDDDTDEGLSTRTYYADDDADGFGDADNIEQSCARPEGYLTNALDCDDTEPLAYPSAVEACDGLDNDCDDAIDEDRITYYADADADGAGDPNTTRSACSAPNGYVTNKIDCDDTDPLVYLGAEEACDGLDNDCDGATDEESQTYYADTDGDGFGDADTSQESCSAPNGYVENGTDCDDATFSTNPSATEGCDGVDNDCDGSTDEEAVTYYADADVDGFGDPDSAISACTLPNGYVTNSGDCDDTSFSTNPGATESCDGTDNDCDGSSDEDAVTYYADGDADGFGDPDTSVAACALPNGYVTNNADCDDARYQSNPSASERCDDEDNDCDGTTDEEAGSTWYIDSDGDGFGDSGTSQEACDKPSGYAALAGDCDDSSSSVYPGKSETCDGLDNDCDGEVDDGLTTDIYYKDADEDGYGDPQDTVEGCAHSLFEGYVFNNDDCDDTDDSISPEGVETCDDVDQDCDGSADEGLGSTWYLDGDGDGYGDSGATTTDCEMPTGYTANDTDCDDSEPERYPGNTESCDDLDNDCDGSVDEEGCTCTYTATWNYLELESSEDGNDDFIGYFNLAVNGATVRAPEDEDYYFYDELFDAGDVNTYDLDIIVVTGSLDAGDEVSFVTFFEGCADDDGGLGSNDCDYSFYNYTQSCLTDNDVHNNRTHTILNVGSTDSVTARFNVSYRITRDR